MNEKRVQYVDVGSGILILWVMAFHLLGTTRETQEKGREVWCAHGKLQLQVKTLRCWALANYNYR